MMLKGLLVYGGSRLTVFIYLTTTSVFPASDEPAHPVRTSFAKLLLRVFDCPRPQKEAGIDLLGLGGCLIVVALFMGRQRVTLDLRYG